MRLEWIEDILSVHDSGSLRAAAENRFLTSSAFTRRIRTVEKLVGSELFDRNNKPVTLRPHVVELIPRLREIATSLRNVQHELSGLGDGVGITRLMCQHTLTVSWAPKVVKTLAKNGAQLRIRSGSKDECALCVLKNDVDIALVYEETNLNINAEEDLFNRINFGQEEFLPVAALKDNQELKDLIELKKIPLVSYPRNLFLGEVQEKTLSQNPDRQYSFATIAEAGLGPAVMEFVREGLGVGWLPSSMISKELANEDFTVLSDFMPAFRLDVVAISAKLAKTKLNTQVWNAIESEYSTG